MLKGPRPIMLPLRGLCPLMLPNCRFLEAEIQTLCLELERMGIWRDVPLSEEKTEAAEPDFDPECEELQVHQIDSNAAAQVQRSRLAYVMQHLEKRLLMSVLRLAGERGIKPLALCYDGLIVDKTTLPEEGIASFLADLEALVKTEFGGLVMPFSLKSMTCPPMPPTFNAVWYDKIKDSFSPEFFLQLSKFNPMSTSLSALTAKLEEAKTTYESFSRGKQKAEAKEEMRNIKRGIEAAEHDAEEKTFKRQLAYFEQFHGVCKAPFMYYQRSRDQIPVFYNKTDFQSLLSSEAQFLSKWFMYTNRVSYSKCDFLPPPIPLPADVLNTYRGLAIESVPRSTADVPLDGIFSHISFLCNGEEAPTKYLTHYLAHMVQRPGENPHVGIVLHSRLQGVGKNILLENFCNTIMGSQYLFSTPQIDQVAGRFSNVPNKFMVILDEVKFKSQREVDGIMKSFITTDVIRWEKKGLAVQDVNNVSRFFILSNETCPVKIEDTDRRYCVIECTVDKVPSRDYFNNLGRLLTDKITMRALYDYLMALDLTKWDPRDIPMTDSKRDMIAVSRHPVHEFIDEFIDTYHGTSGEDGSLVQFYQDGTIVVSSKFLLDLYNKAVSKFGVKPITNTMFSMIMKRELKATNSRKRFTIDGESTQIWCTIFSYSRPTDMSDLGDTLLC
jgi:hypothetical protein